MPLILPENLPAYSVLRDENIFSITHERAIRQDIRPLKILLVNLMPDKISAEIQLARVLANSPLQVELTLLRTGSHVSKNTPEHHLAAFYKTLDGLHHERFDGMIITGAPVEHLNYEDVDYWPEMQDLISYARKNVYSTLYLCWAALAGLYFNHGIPKRVFKQKLHGVFEHRVARPNNPLVRGFDETFYVPHSRIAGVDEERILEESALRVLAASEEAGIHLLSTENGREIYIMGHPEYDKDSLQNEYIRDMNRGMNPPLPKHYYYNDNPEDGIIYRWRSHGNLMFSNWLNYYVYQSTPYDLESL